MFDSIKALIAILLFSKTVLLTTHPIDIGPDWREIHLESPLIAITPGAKLFVDVTSVTGGRHDYESMKKLFPPGQVEARFVDSKGVPVLLHYSDGVAFSNGTESLILDSDAIQVNTKYVQVFIRSLSAIPGIKVTWQNYSK